MPESANWYRRITEILREKYRQLDGDPNDEALIKEIVPRRMDEFVGIVFRKMGQVLEEQVYKKKNGQIVSPPRVTIFLSGSDDKEWRGAKRQALKEDLVSIYLEKLKEIAGKPLNSVGPIEVELKVDEMLEERTVRAEFYWEDNETGGSKEPLEKDKTLRIEDETYQREKTIPFTQMSGRNFFVEIWRDGQKQKEMQFFQDSITIGRNSETKGYVDVHLSDDQRVARLHATMEIDKDENFWITAKGNNAVKVGGSLIPADKTVRIREGEEMQICDFFLRFRT